MTLVTTSIPALQRFTTQYSEIEDRIHIAGETGPDQQAALWLTPRVLNRMVPVLTQCLEKQSGSEIRGEVLQSMAQHAARVALDPQAPVQRKADTKSWLVHTVNMTPVEQGMLLTFRGDANNGEALAASLTLQGRQLRQWLNILYDQSRKAEWPLAAWPAWIRDAQEHKATPPLEVVLH